MSSIWKAAVDELEKGNDFALATILSVAGSSPRHVGTRFIVRRDGSIVGTIGGGLFEADVQKFASSALEKGTSHRVAFSFRGSDALSKEMICGGEAEVLVEFVQASDTAKSEVFKALLSTQESRKSAYLLTQIAIPADGEGEVRHLLIGSQDTRIGGFPGDHVAVASLPERRLLDQAQMLNLTAAAHPVFLEWVRPTGTVFVFGAGHVGQCVVHLAAYVGFRVVVIDDRTEFGSRTKIPDADEVIVPESFDGCVNDLGLDGDSYVVIVTRGHAHDKTVLEQVLSTPAMYIGMIGSRRKTRLIFDSLLQQGFSKEAVDRICAPIGLPIGGESPQEIAVSIVAQMIRVRSGMGTETASVPKVPRC